MATKERKSCHVVSGTCRDDDPKTANQRMTDCFACGEPTCNVCSVRRKHLCFGVQKICHNCATQIDGNDDQLVYREYINADYKITKAWVRALRIYNPQEMYPRNDESLRAQIARWKRNAEVK